MDYMELVQIISTILLFGGVLLIFVILISYLISKSKQVKAMAEPETVPASVIQNRNYMHVQYDQYSGRKSVSQKYPVVYQMEKNSVRDVNILRKPTVTKREIRDKIQREQNAARKTKGNGQRYTIVNDELRKTAERRAINF